MECEYYVTDVHCLSTTRDVATDESDTEISPTLQLLAPLARLEDCLAIQLAPRHLYLAVSRV